MEIRIDFSDLDALDNIVERLSEIVGDARARQSYVDTNELGAEILALGRYHSKLRHKLRIVNANLVLMDLLEDPDALAAVFEADPKLAAQFREKLKC